MVILWASEPMFQITYHSRAEASFTRNDFSELLSQCQRRNRRDHLTGLLLYDGLRFAQAFEGPSELVDECMSRIVSDPRHTAVHINSRERVREREFGSFAMASAVPMLGAPDRFLDEVKRLVEHVTSPSLQALFIGFAAMRRQPTGSF